MKEGDFNRLSEVINTIKSIKQCANQAQTTQVREKYNKLLELTIQENLKILVIAATKYYNEYKPHYYPELKKAA